MKKIILSLLLSCIGFTTMHAQKNMVFKSKKTYNGALSNIGGIAINGAEYALVGWEFGLSIVDVTDPNNIFEVVNIPGSQSIWREVKVWNNHAYVTTEAGGGLQIINLNSLPSPNLPYKNWTGNNAIFGQIDNIHALHIEAGYVYLFGSNLFNGAALICDLNDPWNPNYLGHSQGTYIHDGYVRNDTLFSCHIYDGYFSIINVANKANPVTINTQNTPDNFTHNSWLNDAGNALFTTDEVDNSVLASYDISDPNNIILLDKFQTAPGSQAIVHNTHTLNDYAVVSWYKEGVVVVDISHPDNMIEVGHYDTSPLSGGGFDGCWGVYPFLPSGNIVASDISEGLFVLAPTYVRGCYLEGTATDANTSAPLSSVQVEILSTSVTKFSKTTGVYKTGYSNAGTYSVKYSKLGYISQTINNVVLQNGVVTIQDVQLVPISTVSISGSVIDGSTNLPIPNAQVNLTDGAYNYDLVTDNAGNFNVSNFVTGTYTVTAGMWGYVTDCSLTTTINGGNNVVVTLQPGWYDDFVFDFGWTKTSTANTGDWVREEPVGTFNNNGSLANPELDKSNDCNDKCYMSGNGGGGSGSDDIDDGGVGLSSPIFDLTNIISPKIYYSRWIYNGGGNGTPNDTLYFYLSNGTQEVLLEKVTISNVNASKWTDVNFLVSNYITPTATMKLRVYAEDFGPGNVFEVALDKFFVTFGNVGVNENGTLANALSAFPNPSNSSFNITYNLSELSNAFLQIEDITGRVVEAKNIASIAGNIEIGSELENGAYTLRLINSDKIIRTVKIIKAK